MSGAKPRILVFGDALGHLDAFVKRLQSVNEKNGPFDAAFCVGQFFPAGGSGLQGVEAYFKGEKTIPVPTYFIGDYGEDANSLLAPARSKALDMGFSMSGIPVCDNLFYLKGSGILYLKGLRIAYLSGKYIADVYKNVRGAEASGGHFKDDVDALHAIADEKDVTDIFLSNEWPRGITRSPSAPEGSNFAPTGSDISAELASVLKPRYHFAGSEGVFYAREPYINPGATHVTRFFGLGAVGNDSKQKFVHALSPTPASVLSTSDLASKPINATLSPYVKGAHSMSTARRGQKRDVGQIDKASAADGQDRRYDTSQGKRQRRNDGGDRAKQTKNIVESADGGDTTRENALEPKHKVFLSHSGAQKSFVEQLCVDLERCDRYPFFDKRCSSLPIGKHFPTLIFKAIEQCEVGVVVLSEEFFDRSKWPMLEFVAMRKNPKLVIIPVYFGVSLERVRDPKHQKRWRSIWHGWAKKDKRIDIEEWCGVFKALGPLNSLVYDGGSEVSFREKIVQEVCALVLPETRWNDSHVQGRCRLAKVICEEINKAKVSKKYGICLVGLHGVGGIGKTTICQMLCNEYAGKMRGRVFHMELGSASNLELLQGALKTLTDKSHDVLCKLDKSRCQSMLKEEMGKQAVFLAIDNMSDSTESIEQAKMILSSGFANGSIVIVTARSLDVLKFRFLDIANRNCLEMPELHKDEAKSLFVEHAICGDETRTKVDDEIIDSCLKRCNFEKGDGKSYHYHPLALKVLGMQLSCKKYDRNKWAAVLKELDTFNRGREKEHPVFSILRKSFDILLPIDQMLFMDVALFLPDPVLPGFNMTLFEWLSMVHVTSVRDIKERLEELKRKSVLQDLGDGRSSRIGIHDLWREFAVVESRAGEFECRRWVYEMGEPSGLEEEGSPSRGCWQRMKRMRFLGNGLMSAKGIHFDHFSNIIVLSLVSDIILPGGLVLDVSMLKLLKSLELVLRCDGKARVDGLSLVVNLQFLHLGQADFSAAVIEDIGRLTKLRVLVMRDFEGARLPDLSELISLEEVLFSNCSQVTTTSGLSSRLSNLRVLELHECGELRSLNPGLEIVDTLQNLALSSCENLNKLPNLHKFTNLQKLDISECSRIKLIPGLDDLVTLEQLWAQGCQGVEELPNLKKLTNLRKLDIRKCSGVKLIPGLDDLVALEHLLAEGCEGIEELPNLKKLTNLRKLDIRYCSGVKLISGLDDLVALEHLWAEGCEGIEELPNLKKLTNL